MFMTIDSSRSVLSIVFHLHLYPAVLFHTFHVDRIPFMNPEKSFPHIQ